MNIGRYREIKVYIIEEKYLIDKIYMVMKQLYKEQTLSGDKQRDIAQELESVLNAIITIDY